MKKILFILCMTISCAAFAQEKHPYIYGQNNVSLSVTIRGLPHSFPFRVQIVITRETQSSTEVKNILGTVFDKYINCRPGDTQNTVPDIPSGIYGVGLLYFCETFWCARVYNYQFDNDSAYICLNEN